MNKEQSLGPVLSFVVAIGGSLVAFSAHADGPPSSPTAVLTMRLGLRNNNGQVGCLLFNQATGYPKDQKAALQRKWCPIVSSVSVCAFDPIPAGT